MAWSREPASPGCSSLTDWSGPRWTEAAARRGSFAIAGDRGHHDRRNRHRARKIRGCSLAHIQIDEPTIAMIVRRQYLAVRRAAKVRYVTSRNLRDRLEQRAADQRFDSQVEDGDSALSRFRVIRARGELQLSPFWSRPCAAKASSSMVGKPEILTKQIEVASVHEPSGASHRRCARRVPSASVMEQLSARRKAKTSTRMVNHGSRPRPASNTRSPLAA